MFLKIAPRQSWRDCAWYSVKICIIFGVRFQSRKVDNKTHLHKTWSIQTVF